MPSRYGTEQHFTGSQLNSETAPAEQIHVSRLFEVSHNNHVFQLFFFFFFFLAIIHILKLENSTNAKVKVTRGNTVTNIFEQLL